MNEKLRKGVLVVLSITFVVSACVLAYELLQYKKGDAVYSEAEALVDLPTLPERGADTPPAPVPEDSEENTDSGEVAKPVYVDPYADALRNMDFTALQAVNTEVLGWILIPGTKVSYPMVQGADNDYYLDHTWKKTSGSVGAIFMDYRCAQDLSGFNTIVYGHRMNNGSMFASLKYYKKQNYFKQHPTVYLTTAQGAYQYEIFSVYEGSPTGESYRTGFSSQARKQAFLDMAVGASLYDTGVKPAVSDSILTLSTCTGNGHAKRLIVHALRRGYAAADDAAPPADSPEAVPESGDSVPTIDPAQPAEEEPAASTEQETPVPDADVASEDTGAAGEAESPVTPEG